jgi:hypothetical protein
MIEHLAAGKLSVALSWNYLCIYTHTIYTLTLLCVYVCVQGLSMWAMDKLSVVQSLDPESYTTLHTALASMLGGMQVRSACVYLHIRVPFDT